MAVIQHFGAAQEVTGSCHLLCSEANGRVLLDCGMYQGHGKDDDPAEHEFPFDIASLNAVVLSHAHLDHSGMLPLLVRRGYAGPIFCTAATRDLLEILLEDSFGLYSKDLERDNLRRKRRGEKPLKLAYTEKDVKQVIRQCHPLDYGSAHKIAHGYMLTLHDAGHILGSSIVQLSFVEQGQHKTLVFSGDLGKPNAVLMNDPYQPTQADLVMMESTYGDREHRSIDDTVEQLEQILHDAWQRGGNVMIPSFAVGRTQELIYHLGCLHQQGKLDDWQIFLDSPMAIRVTDIYDRWVDILDKTETRYMNVNHLHPLEDFLPNLFMAVTPEDSMAINRIRRGAIIIAGSGMCTGGRIKHHFKQRIWNPHNTLIFVGYQARGTLGRALVDGAKFIKMFGEQYMVKARIETLGGFSAHAGQSDLLNWVKGFNGEPKVVLVHGEPDAMQVLAEKIWQHSNIRVTQPALGDRSVL
ncbi:MBL fold metallo-hydrolase RNA specificity domain-containing protein [Bowmanella sp. JS7-9]|uniref:MBL fold metallo-hydrolase RNA specificity domain-containing protein n=1 Tax=Pseudobowmanella zhangzhouensis TaxID=1537679 RepID=A0ABW1XGY0_9ALTE|nr:MBL fold metallo-hydrolase [Bowmanella sp. JS7-9]TBX21347.1 beta-lactamase [Bowmanella sp. JS7-9]